MPHPCKTPPEISVSVEMMLLGTAVIALGLGALASRVGHYRLDRSVWMVLCESPCAWAFGQQMGGISSRRDGECRVCMASAQLWDRNVSGVVWCRLFFDVPCSGIAGEHGRFVSFLVVEFACSCQTARQYRTFRWIGAFSKPPLVSIPIANAADRRPGAEPAAFVVRREDGKGEEATGGGGGDQEGGGRSSL